jgi:phenylacetate-CoA ligase
MVMFPPLLTNKIIHPLRCRLNTWHKNVSDISASIIKSEWASADELYALQEKKLQKLCREAANGSSYYREIFYNTGIDPERIALDSLSKLPILDKTTIRENFGSIINQNYPKDQINKNATGGSSGEPLILCQSRHSNMFSAALYLRGLQWCGMKKGYPHVKLWGAPTDVQKTTTALKSRMWNYLYNMRTIDAFNAGYTLFEKEYCNLLNKTPFMLESYSNILYEFARYLKENEKERLLIPAVISSAGVLYDFQREVIQETISKNVFNRYGSREFGNIAQECDHHTGMHINMERFVIEIDTPDNNGTGDILVTDLENIAFPFIRYRIGDTGRISKNLCTCGRKSLLFENVIGRSLDIIKAPSGRMISGEMFPHFFKDFSQIILGQVVQDKKDHLEVRLKLKRGSSVFDIEPLIKKIKDTIGNEMKVSVNTEKDFVSNPTGKYRPVISNIK